MKKQLLIGLVVVASFVFIIGIVTICCLVHYIGISKCVGENKTSYTEKEIHVEYDDINLYGEVLIPNGEKKYPLVIYAHGAESHYDADYTTLKSLSLSGIACYAFDFYGWSKKSTGPKKGDWFKGTPLGVDDSYEKQVLDQVNQLNHVIEKCKTFPFVDTNNVFLLGSSMGGATVATCAVTHTTDIQGIILQYPNLNPKALVDEAQYDVNKYAKNVLILTGSKDKITPLPLVTGLYEHYNCYQKHATMKVYEGQPHVFDGRFKVTAAKDIYDFIRMEGNNSCLSFIQGNYY